MCLSVLPGEPTDGSGRICIHLFVQDERGPFVEPHVLHLVVEGDGQQSKRRLVARPTRGRLACDPKKLIAPVVKSGVLHVTMRTDELEGVSCPKCKKSKDYELLVESKERT